MKGIYIVLEGTVGTGKTTQAKKILEYLRKKHPAREVILTREPGGDEIAEAIRKLVQGTNFSVKMTPECEAYLYASQRAQSLRTIVRPCLERGGIVIADRSFLSSAAYQGHARGLGIQKILDINRIAVDSILPDQIIYFDMSPEAGLMRIFDKDGDKFEKENVEFFRKVEEGYTELSKMPEFSGKWHSVNAKGNVEEVFSRIRVLLP